MYTVYNANNNKKGIISNMSEGFDVNIVDAIIDRHGGNPSAIIPILQEVQEQYRYLPKDVFAHISKRLKISRAKIYSIATFYENFSLEPKGKYVLKVCDGTACHVRKSIPILERLYRDLGLSSDKHTTDDLLFTIETVACLGACSLAPIVMANEKVYATMTPDLASELLETLKKEESDSAE
jgi:NADH-quinone oxidoreductase subunit E